MTRRGDRLEALFHELADADAERRSDRLGRVAEEDAALAAELRRLLAADESEATEPGERSQLDEADDARSERVGPYLLVRLLGEGGMGVVWEAEQSEPVRRRVALKLLSGRATGEMRRRFDAERQALALLDHPNIASLYDSGTTDRGEPWFAMELVEGEPITDYCDRHAMDISGRLELFAELCDAVQHAHRRGLIHRDLKPANIIVGGPEKDVSPAAGGRRSLRVIDFGIAKAFQVEDDAQSGERLTMAGAMIGTPEYMSPEQAGHEDGVVDTRTDVYALGVILYELLVGALPISSDALRRAGLEGMRRLIRDRETPKPSSRLDATTSEQTTEIARRRAVQPATLVRRLQGDLDWIVLKALAKSKTRRYDSPLALAEDLRRYAAGDPVVAGPPTFSYRLRKWSRKHRVAALSIALVTVLVVGAVVAISAALVRARAAERAAHAEVQQERATRQFLVDLFAQSDPFERDPWTGRKPYDQFPSTQELVDRGARRLLEPTIDDPLTRSRLQITVGRLYANLARDEEARELLMAALDILESFDQELREQVGAEVAEGRTLARLTLGDLELGRGDSELAVSVYREALETVPPDQAYLQARAHASLAEALRVSARHDDGLTHAVTAVELARRATAADAVDRDAQRALEQALWTLAAMRAARGEAVEAAEVYRSLAQMQAERLGPDHPRLAMTYRGLSHALEVAGDYAAGAEMAERTLASSRAALGDSHPVVAYDLMQVAAGHRVHGRYAEAVELLQEAEMILRRTRGRTPPLATTLAELGMSLEQLGRAKPAAAAHAESVEIFEEVHGPHHPEVGAALSRLSSALRASERPEEALPISRRALEITRSVHPEGHWRVVVALAEVVQVLLATGDHEQALLRADELVDLAQRVLGDQHVMYAAVQTMQADALIRVASQRSAPELLDRAAAVLATSRSIFEQQQGSRSPNLQYVADLEEKLATAHR